MASAITSRSVSDSPLSRPKEPKVTTVQEEDITAPEPQDLPEPTVRRGKAPPAAVHPTSHWSPDDRVRIPNLSFKKGGTKAVIFRRLGTSVAIKAGFTTVRQAQKFATAFLAEPKNKGLSARVIDYGTVDPDGTVNLPTELEIPAAEDKTFSLKERLQVARCMLREGATVTAVAATTGLSRTKLASMNWGARKIK
jgi:transposase-like protein